MFIWRSCFAKARPLQVQRNAGSNILDDKPPTGMCSLCSTIICVKRASFWVQTAVLNAKDNEVWTK
jgi:hypothetical protein